jgi:hypothetical protein
MTSTMLTGVSTTRGAAPGQAEAQQNPAPPGCRGSRVEAAAVLANSSPWSDTTATMVEESSARSSSAARRCRGCDRRSEPRVVEIHRAVAEARARPAAPGTGVRIDEYASTGRTAGRRGVRSQRTAARATASELACPGWLAGADRRGVDGVRAGQLVLGALEAVAAGDRRGLS